MITALDPIERAGPSLLPGGAVRYTIATLVNRPTMYHEMVASLRSQGFTDDCEFIHVADPGCAYRDLNRLLAAARGEFVILCHQDVRLVDDGRAALDRRLAALDRSAPDWGLAGVAGGIAPGRLALRISDPHGADQRVGALPARVATLDECLIVVRRAARLGFSRDLTGFHLYGADICLVADTLGHSAWVIDFHVQHLSAGRKDASFREAEAAFRAKWSRAVRPRWLQTTCTLLRIGGPRLPTAVTALLERIAGGLARRYAGISGGWSRAGRIVRPRS